ncbi:MAG: 3-hydroxyacyl-CoA dehydrogenase family protein [Myxococcota bacterium]|nr:3-hydroxyacyl-CoA dehydrogenase family protein [Myxococcota bacterium]
MGSIRVGVIGAGVMGSGIAQSIATAGYETVGYDVSQEAVEQAVEGVRSGRYGFERAVSRGKLSREEADAALERLSFTTDLDRAADAGLVVECVPEDLALKIRVFRDLDARAPADAVLASNTSGFSIAAIAAATDRPERVVGWHWASPPPVMRFAEVVRGPATGDAAVDRVVEVARACGKNPIVVKDSAMSWGFVANRVYGAMLREAARVVQEGIATHEEVNQLMVDCFNWPVGPFAMVKGATEGWK